MDPVAFSLAALLGLEFGVMPPDRPRGDKKEIFRLSLGCRSVAANEKYM